jgi:hypothetical protein
MSIAAVAIAIAVLVVSNLTSLFPLVFLTARTVPISLGLLALAALSSGVLASIFLRLLATGKRQTRQDKKAERRAQQNNFEAEPQEQEFPFRPVDRTRREPELVEDENLERPVVDRGYSRENSTVYDANYRVIRAPQSPANSQPQVNSKLKPDEEDWGFDFEEDDR